MKNFTKLFSKFVPSVGSNIKSAFSVFKGFRGTSLNFSDFRKGLGFYNNNFTNNKLFSTKENESEEIYENFNKKSQNSEISQNAKNEEMFNIFNEDFDKALSTNEEDQAKRVRLLSIKLLQINNSREIINLFEEKYIKGLVNNIYGEELSLFVYFYVSLLDKEVKETNLVESNNSRGRKN